MQMSQKKYVRICRKFNDSGFLVSTDQVSEYVEKSIQNNKPLYTSTYYYSEADFKVFQQKKSVAGMRDLKTDKIWFDFDDRNNFENVRKDAIELIDRLKKNKIDEKSIKLFFSGGKGLHVIVDVENDLTRKDVETVCRKLSKGLNTFDASLYDYSQILRVEGTPHNETKRYKVPLKIEQLKTSPYVDILTYASDLNNVKDDFSWERTSLSIDLLREDKKEEKIKVEVSSTLSKILRDKPKHWKDYKWALLNAFGLNNNERHSSMLVLAATCKGLGYPEELARSFLESFDDKYALTTKGTKKPEEIDNVITSVYSEFWNGGQGSPKSNEWLRKYCERIGVGLEEEKHSKTISIDQAFDLFKSFAENIDELTIPTGIPALDKNLKMTIGMSVGIVAAPSVGKTSLALQILNTISKQNIPAIFFSYDMFHALVYQKLVQKHMNLIDEEIFDIFRTKDIKKQDEIRAILKEEYGNVEFCFEAGQSVDDIRNEIKAVEERLQKKVKLIVVDYNELVITDESDSTSSSAYVAQKLREIGNVEQLCVISLFQPNKISGSPSDEIKSYRNAKGSSAIEQSVSIMLGMSRPGFDPRRPEDDEFLTISCLKNRMGKIFSLDLHWHGLTGTVRELEHDEIQKLKEIRQRKNDEDKSGGFGGFS